MKFKVGDRVKIYSAEGINYGHVEGIHEPTGNMGVKLISADRIVPVHYKQCRRLIKKKRLEVWVSKEFLSSWESLSPCPHIYPLSDKAHITNTKNYIKFREVIS